MFSEEERVRLRNIPYNKLSREEKKIKIRSMSPPPLRPAGKPKWKAIFLTFFLLFTGLFFLIIGYFRFQSVGFKETYHFFILSTLLIIPGAYHGVIILFIWFGVEGWSYDMLPDVDN